VSIPTPIREANSVPVAAR
jgi:hypothetical protein